uniref:Proteinase inhibitor A n=1 Tax=Sagittaria sagittifolia TaxID=4451 RepID=IPRA_SAGSA|nr:RecName: Full=Proteinase inhibitor A; AltName: Full=Double-headed proteinase inhibitor A; Short=API-A; Flags: Precursor [Sagittaria sagittifolia]BAA02972.1 proteinase inhibitor A [Sagittaria sagittifolia]
MAASNALLLISGVLLISLAVLCHGDPVVDSDGDAVQLNLGGNYPLYTIQSAAIGFRGGLSTLHKDACKSYVYEAPETDRGLPVGFSASATSQPVMQLGSRYKFSFSMPVPLICDTAWSIGKSTEETGVYKLAACSCEFCKIACPEVGSFNVNGRTLLGIGGEHFTVRFQKFDALAMKTAPQ